MNTQLISNLKRIATRMSALLLAVLLLLPAWLRTKIVAVTCKDLRSPPCWLFSA